MTSSKARLVPLTGVAAVVLLVIAFILGGDPPEVDEGGQAVIDFYLDEEASNIVASILLGYAAVLLVFFFSSVRGRLRREEDAGAVLSTAGFGGGLLLALGISLFGGLNFTLADFADELDPTAAQAILALNYDLFFPVALGTEVFFLATGIAMVRGAGFPSWLGWLAIVIGVVALTPVGFFALLAGLVWIIVAGVLFAVRPAEASPGPPPPAAPASSPEIR